MFFQSTSIASADLRTRTGLNTSVAYGEPLLDINVRLHETFNIERKWLNKLTHTFLMSPEQVVLSTNNLPSRSYQVETLSRAGRNEYKHSPEQVASRKNTLPGRSFRVHKLSRAWTSNQKHHSKAETWESKWSTVRKKDTKKLRSVQSSIIALDYVHRNTSVNNIATWEPPSRDTFSSEYTLHCTDVAHCIELPRSWTIIIALTYVCYNLGWQYMAMDLSRFCYVQIR